MKKNQKPLSDAQNRTLEDAIDASLELAQAACLARSEIRNALTTAKRMTRVATRVEAIPGGDLMMNGDRYPRFELPDATIDGPEEDLLRAAMELLKRLESAAAQAFRCIDKIPQDA